MYNQPFSQSPEMFGSQSGAAQMQSAPSLPPGNAPGREYFNHSMATFTNAMQTPPGMMPQGISSLVPAYQSGGGVGIGLGADADTSGNVAIDFGSLSAAIDAAQADADADAAAAAAGYDFGFSQADADAAAAAASIAQAQAQGQAAVDSFNDASRGAATQGGPPDVDFTNLALEALQAPTAAPEVSPDTIQAAINLSSLTGGTDQSSQGRGTDQFTQGQGTQGGPPDVDFSNLAINALQDDSDAQQAEFSSLLNDEVARSSGEFPTVRGTMSPSDYRTYYDSRIAAARDPEYAKSRQDLYNFLVNDYKGNVVTGKDEITKAEDLNKGVVNSLIKGATPFQQGPVYNPVTGSMTGGTYVDRGGAVGSGIGTLVGGPFGALVGGFLGSGRGGYAPVNSIMGGNSGDFNNPGMDMANVSLPERLLAVNEPDAGDPNDSNDPNDVPDVPDASATPTAQALAPLVYQAYANLGLPVPGNVPAFRRVNIPTSRFTV